MKKRDKNKYQEYSQYVTVRKTFYTVFLKRFLDIIFSLVGIIILIPSYLILHICVLCDVGFPIIFKQERIGKGCRPFTIYKYRNMNNKTDENGNLLPGDQRATKFGRIYRATS